MKMALAALFYFTAKRRKSLPEVTESTEQQKGRTRKMRKMKKINGYLVVRFNDREKREYEGTALGNFGVIDAELYTGILDVDRSVMEYDNAETLKIAMELARGLEAELDVEEPETKITVIIEGETEVSEEEIEPESLFQEEREWLAEQLQGGRYAGLTPDTAAHQLTGYARALKDLGIVDDLDERFMVEPGTFGAAPPQENFRHTPETGDGLLARKVYRLGLAMEAGCPNNDCIIYRNNFRMARELDEALDGAQGYAAEVLRREQGKHVRELRRMYFENVAVKAYRKAVEGYSNGGEPGEPPKEERAPFP